MLCWQEQGRGGAELVKTAADAADGGRLAHERAVLAQVSHPGLVELVSPAVDDGQQLRTRWIDGGTLAERHDLEGAELLGVGAALATTLADLHDIGVSHGAVEPGHTLIDERGHPVLCSMGRATIGTPGDARAAAAGDTTALCRMLLERLPATTARSVRRLMQTGASGRPVGARNLARCLSAPEVEARLPAAASRGEASPGPVLAVDARNPRMRGVGGVGGARGVRGVRWLGRMPFRLPGRYVLLAVVGVVAVVVCGATLVGVTGRGRPAARAFGRGCPGVDASCLPLPYPERGLAVDGVRYAVGQPGDVVVLGRWGCGPRSRPALLRPGTGRIWVFDRWATAGGDVVGRPLPTVPRAGSLRVLPGRSGCDRLAVLGATGTTIGLLDPREP